MIGIILGRLSSAVPILLIVSLITFGMMHLIPGDPAVAIAGVSATAEQILQLRHDLGLDQPLLTQLYRWYAGLLHGDLGRSLLMGQPVLEVMLFRLPVTLALSLYALVLTVLLGLLSGIFAALRQNTAIDQLAMVFAMFGISVPNFWMGLLMIIFFARLARLAADRRICGVHRRPGRLAAHLHHAGVFPGAVAGGPAGADHPLDDAGGAAPGLHPHRPCQGPAAPAGGDEARAHQRADPDHDRHRHHHQPARSPARW